MKKSKLLLIASLVLALTMTLGGTMAYLTDMDSEVNTFTLGQVNIEVKEENFTDGAPLWPGEQTDKDAYIVNQGKTDAWVWMTVVVPGNIADYVIPVWADGITPDYTTTDETTGDKTYTVLVDEKLTSGETTEKILDAMKMTENIDVQNNQMGVVTDGVFTAIDTADLEKLNVTVNGYAIQATEGIENVQDAYEFYNAQYSTGNGGSSEDEEPGEDEEPTVPEGTPVSTLDELKAAIAKGGTIVLMDNITTSETITMPQNTTVVIDLNQHTIKTSKNVNLIQTNFGSKMTLKNGTLNGGDSATVNTVVNFGTMIIDSVIVQTGEKAYASIANANNLNNTPSLTIQGNTVVSGKLSKGSGQIVIQGGTFYVNPTSYVDKDNYTVTTNTDGTYTVTAK